MIRLVASTGRLTFPFYALLIFFTCLALGGCAESIVDTQSTKAPAFANATKTQASESTIADHPFVRMAGNKPPSGMRRALAVKEQRPITPNDLLTWAESAFPDLFPGNEATLTWQNYQFRYYPGTGTYLAVDNSNIVWILSTTLTGGQLVEVGPLSRYAGWVTTSLERFAAARQLEQATFGPSPSAIEEVISKGFEAWLDEQLAMKATLVDPEPARDIKQGDPKQWFYHVLGVHKPVIEGQDQIRQRVAWSLSQFIVVSQNGGPSTPYGLLHFYKMLQESALGNYRDILRETTAHPTMGWYLGNWQNRAKGACDGCTPSENYARELLQLFSLGVYRLNQDSSFLLDSQGKRIPTYTQRDIEELARALTGWRTGGDGSVPCNQPASNLLCFERRMYGGPGFQGWGHDMGSKKVLGTEIPANQGAVEDLESVLDIIMNHPNLAPFVSRRLIQHLVTSNPSPDYVRRVSSVFTRSKGDMKQTIKAILLDQEAREGDLPNPVSNRVGKIRESMQATASLWRSLGCSTWPVRISGPAQWLGHPVTWYNQAPLAARNVFGYYSPENRTPSTNLNSPEHTLLDADHYRRGFGDDLFSHRENLRAAKCSIDGFIAAFEGSEEAFIQLVNERFFKGYMSYELRAQAREIIRLTKGVNEYARGGYVLNALLMSPEYRSLR